MVELSRQTRRSESKARLYRDRRRASRARRAVWTRRAGGDDSLAIMVTIITNLLCFFVTPAWVYYLAGNETDQAKFVGTIFKLLYFVVIPMIVGQLVRFHQSSAKWATAQKRWLSLAAQLGVLFMIFLGAVSTGIRVSESGGFHIRVDQVFMMVGVKRISSKR